jgi:hypothetical protein
VDVDVDVEVEMDVEVRLGDGGWRVLVGKGGGLVDVIN